MLKSNNNNGTTTSAAATKFDHGGSSSFSSIESNRCRQRNVFLAIGTVAAFVLVMKLVGYPGPWTTSFQDRFRYRSKESSSSSSSTPQLVAVQNATPATWPLIDQNNSTATDMGIILKILQELDRQLDGQVLLRSNGTDFQRAAHVWNQCGAADQDSSSSSLFLPPLAVIEVQNENDVQRAVPVLAILDQRYQVPFRIRSGGHSYAGWSTVSNGIILSLSQLNHVVIQSNPTNELTVAAWNKSDSVLVAMGPAVRVQDELQQLLQAHGLGSVMGWCPTVATGGYTLGGGQGAWSRQYGLGLDQVVAARIVLLNGSVVTANASQHSDLFWALRGAGQGNFGVVTELVYQFYPSQDTLVMASGFVNVTSSMGHDTAKNFSEILHRLALLEPSIPGQVGAFLSSPGSASTAGAAPGEQFSVSFMYVSQTDDEVSRGKEEIEKVLKNLGLTPSSFDFQTNSWTEFSMERVPRHEGYMVRIWNGFLFPQHNTPQACRDIVNNLQAVIQTSPNYTLAAFELWGGAVARVKPSATAFYWRQGVYNVRIALMVPYNATNATETYRHTVSQLDPLWNNIAQYLNGTYTNYATASLRRSEYASVTYGENLERLQMIKHKYDPNNVFRHPHSIPLPARS